MDPREAAGAMRFVVAAVVLILHVAGLAHAESVYKCRDADGHVAYQDHACSRSQHETQVEIAAAPPPSPSPEYRLPADSRSRSARNPMRSSPARASAVSWECRAANGEVFYRHSRCPGSIRARGDARGSARSVEVSGSEVPRSEACRRMSASGASGRAGHERDQRVSTYERNGGRDPCRKF